MKIKGKKVQKVFPLSKEETFKKCLSAINQLGYSIVEANAEVGVLSFSTNFGAFSLKTNGDYFYRCSVYSVANGSSQCTIWCEECLHQPIPIFEILTNQSCKYSQKVIDLM